MSDMKEQTGKWIAKKAEPEYGEGFISSIDPDFNNLLASPDAIKLENLTERQRETLGKLLENIAANNPALSESLREHAKKVKTPDGEGKE